MKIQLIEQSIEKAIRDVTLEFSVMEPGQRTREGETSEHLEAELEMLKRLPAEIGEWNLGQQRIVIGGMAKDREEQ